MNNWIPYNFREKDDNIGFIEEIGKNDSYYGKIASGTRIKFIRMINDYYFHHKDEGWISAYLQIQQGRYEGQILHLYRVRLSKEFPFASVMKRRINEHNL